MLGEKERPDLKGIETCNLAVPFSSPSVLCEKERPDLKGIETDLVFGGTQSVVREKERPDLKGIET